MRRLAVLLVALLAATPALALDLKGQFVQGGMVTGKAPPGSRVTMDGKAVPIAPDGTFILGFGRNAEAVASLKVLPPRSKPIVRFLDIAPRTFNVQRIDNLPKRKVTPQKRDWTRIKNEQTLINEARQLKTLEHRFKGGFQWPLTGRISGVFGSQRILNGKPRRPHYGTDIAAPPGTPIGAMAAGRVVLVHQDMFFTGKTVMIDHGLGLTSIYIHMSKISVKGGDTVEKGQKIGEVGMTGRATGPHLHWGVAWQKTQLDPQLLVGKMPK